MIQRPQSLFLLGVAGLLFFSTTTTLWTLERLDAVIITIDSFKMVVTGRSFSTIYLAISALVPSALALLSVFLYKNRQRQLQIGLVNMLLISINMMLLVFKAIPDAEKVLGGLELKGTYGFGVYFVLIAIVLNFLASKFIRKDDDLVKSVDRIR